MAFGLGNILGAVGSLFGIGGGGGGGGLDLNALASLIAGQATAQRIPGQTTPGSYTPPQGGFGTYNYIPTGAEQIDPALLWQIMNLGGLNNAAADTATGVNTASLLPQGLSNPYNAIAQQWAGRAGEEMAKTGAMAGGMQDWLNTQALPIYGASQQGLQNYAQLFGQAQNNPLAQSYISGAQNIGQGLTQAGEGIQGAAMGALEGGQQAAQQVLANPYTGQAQAGANQAGGMLGATGQDQFNLGRQFSGQVAAGLPAASQILNTAFDPQNALYDQTLQRTMDQIGTLMARTGTTDSGTGLAYGGDVLRDFNIDWQNRQLGRQLEGLQGYTAGMTGAGQNLGTGTNLQATGAQNVAAGGAMPYQTYRDIGTGTLDTLGQLANLARTTAGTTSAAGDLQLGGNMAGYDAFTNNLNNQLGFADAYSGGVNNLSNIYGGLSNVAGNNAALGMTAANALQGAGQLPYGTYQQQYGNQNLALQNFLDNAAGISNLSTQPIGAMQNYMGGVFQGASNAANAASGAQTATTNQNAQATAGLSPLISGGLNWLSGLFGNSGGSNPAAGYYPSFTYGQ